jgi:acyl-CoA thioesterase
MDRTDENAVAERCRDVMYARDRASRALGIDVVAIGPGFAHLAFTVREDMLNGHAVCHGGLLFTLADSAFAFACNSRNAATLALQGSITFAAPARLGERIEAIARERTLGGRTGAYDVDVSGPQGTIALFRGVSYRVSGTVIGDA